ncbi:MAG: phosphatidate cytidylyltransferase [Lachnospiraceae bacterium]|nr:phosphatidate cytidylyltransferase [Lachnospiraceae bacterium]
MFWKRTLSGAVLLLASFVFIYLGGVYLSFAVCGLSLVAYFEMTRALGLKWNDEFKYLTAWGYVAIAALYICIAFNVSNIFLAMIAVLSVILYLAIYVVKFPKYKAEDVTASVFAFMYGPVMLSFIPLTRGLENGIYIVWMIYICSWGYDTFAYLVGMAFGKTIGNHKAFPVLSPKKSIEGIVGGILGAMLLAYIYGSLLLPEYTWMLVIMAFPGGLIAQVGDLAASAVKRDHNIKDYSNLIPGHGGVLDRFDSMIFTAPIIYCLACLLMFGI